MIPAHDFQVLAAEIEQAQVHLDRAREIARAAAPQAEFCSDGDVDFLPHNLLPPGEAARRAGVTEGTVRRWARDDGIGRKIGGRWWISIPRLRARKMPGFS